MRSGRWMWSFVVMAVVAAACGGSGGSDDSDGGTTSDTVVTSGDGSARLSIPAGAMGSDVEVTIERIDSPDAPDGSTTLAFDLQPSGLEFNEPATLFVTIPVEGAGFPAAFVGVGDGVDDGTAVDTTATVADGEVTIEAQIDHFSVATLRIWWAVFPVESDCPAVLAVEGTCGLEIPGIAGYSGMESEFTGIAPYSIVESTQSTAVLKCNDETDGAVDAVDIYLQLSWDALQDAVAGITDPHLVWLLEHTSGTHVIYQQECATSVAEAGSDPTGDQYDGRTSSPVGEGEGQPASDITRVAHRIEDGVHVFTVEVAGDGQALAEAETTKWYDVIVQVRGSDGRQWSANAAYFGGEHRDRGIRIGGGPDAEQVDDGTVGITWLGSSTFEVRVDTAGADIDVESFEIVVLTELDDETSRYDVAEGTAG